MPRGPRIDVGTVIAGRYEITGLVGGGGMAFVYRAVDREHERAAAIKVMQAALIRSPEFRERFDREARLANHTFHPHILPIWGSGEDRGIFYIATPLADTDLGAFAAENMLTVTAALRLLSQVGWALDFAHDRGVVHRDVKPENILLLEHPGGDHHAYLADFGIARGRTGVTLTGNFMPLTAGYAAPEQIEGSRDIDGRADQYALACTLFDVLTGDTPFHATDSESAMKAHVSSPPPRITDRRADLAAGLDDVLFKALAKRREDRYESCAQFIDACRQAAELSTIQVPSPGFGEPTSHQRSTLPDTSSPVTGGGDATRFEPRPTPVGQGVATDPADAVKATVPDPVAPPAPEPEPTQEREPPPPMPPSDGPGRFERFPEPQPGSAALAVRRRTAVLAAAGVAVVGLIIAVVVLGAGGGGGSSTTPTTSQQTLVPFRAPGSRADAVANRQALDDIAGGRECGVARVSKGEPVPTGNIARSSCPWTSDPNGGQRTEYWLFSGTVDQAFDDLADDGRLGAATAKDAYRPQNCPDRATGDVGDLKLAGDVRGRRACLQDGAGRLKVVWAIPAAKVIGITSYHRQGANASSAATTATWEAALADSWRTLYKSDSDVRGDGGALDNDIGSLDGQICNVVGSRTEVFSADPYSHPAQHALAGSNCDASASTPERLYRRFDSRSRLNEAYKQFTDVGAYNPGVTPGAGVKPVLCDKAGDGDQEWLYHRGKVEGRYQCLVRDDGRLLMAITYNAKNLLQIMTVNGQDPDVRNAGDLWAAFTKNGGFA